MCECAKKVPNIACLPSKRFYLENKLAITEITFHFVLFPFSMFHKITFQIINNVEDDDEDDDKRAARIQSNSNIYQHLMEILNLHSFFGGRLVVHPNTLF